MRIVGVLLVAWGVVASMTIGVRAAERAFECPLTSPIDGRTPLAHIRILHDGSAPWGRRDPDKMSRGNGVTYSMSEWAAWRFFKARMNCEYGWNRRPPFHVVAIDMPGLLLRCEDESPDPPPSEDRLYGRLWCTTDSDAQP